MSDFSTVHRAYTRGEYELSVSNFFKKVYFYYIAIVKTVAVPYQCTIRAYKIFSWFRCIWRASFMYIYICINIFLWCSSQNIEMIAFFFFLFWEWEKYGINAHLLHKLYKGFWIFFFNLTWFFSQLQFNLFLP